MTNRLDLGEFTIPLDFESIWIGDPVRSQACPIVAGYVTKIGKIGNVDGVRIARPGGIDDVILKGDIVPLGYANAETI